MYRAFLLNIVLAVLVHNYSYAGTLEFAASSYIVAENVSTFQVYVTRSGNISASASVTVKSADGTALVTQDYFNLSSALSWISGDGTSKSVTVTILDDSLVEGVETFQLDLININGDTVGVPDSTTITITDYEEGVVEFSSANYQVSEAQSSAILTVSRSSGSNGEVNVDYASADGLAKVQQDYLASSGTLNFPDGVTSRQVIVTLLDDEIGEIPQLFNVNLSNLTGGATLGAVASTSVEILDDDLDFTPALSKLSPVLTDTTQVDAIDLGQAALLDTGKTLLDTINDIGILSTTDLEALQNSNGELNIVVGDQVFFFRPLQVLRSATVAEPAMFLNIDNSGLFMTADEVDILFQPALGGISVLQTALAGMGMPELVINANGNLTIQADQGPPPLELNENGEVVINNSYYDRFNLRPNGIALVSEANEQGIQLLPHPTFPEEVILAVNFNFNSILRQQILNSAPIDLFELIAELESIGGVSDVELRAFSVLFLKYNGNGFYLLPDYIVRRVAEFDPIDVGLSIAGDINLDGYDDINMVYANGDAQYLFYFPIP